MEDKRHDEMDSLAAFLHSGSSEPVPEPSKRPEPAKKAEPVKKPEPIREQAAPSGSSLNDVLFSLDRKKAEKSAPAVTVAEPDEPVVYDEEEDELPDIPEYSDYENDNGHYDDAATQMMNVVNVPVKRTSAAVVTTEEDDEEEAEEDKREQREIREMRIRYEKQRQHARTFAFVLIGAFLCVGILAVSVYLSRYIVTYALDLTGIVTNDFRIDVIIPEDADKETVAAILAENNIISSPKFFTAFGELTKKEDTFIPGTYTLSSTMSYMTLYSTMQKEAYQSKIVTIRIVEGMTAREIGELLEENCVCFAEDFEKYYKNIQNNYDFERRLSESHLKYNQLEGYLFPDTYEFYVVQAMEDKSLHGGTSEEALEMYENSEENAEEVAMKIYNNFNDKMTRIMYKQMGEMNMTLDEVITLASMVQKEAASVDDMYYVASVFLNRIRNSESFPKLQSDVTVLYVENEVKPYLTANSARFNSIAAAYNTYECDGIPAGPICNPGLDAIDAVLNAAETNYFYFCANEETGEVFYAETQEQHEENLILAGLKE
ncbi:MAG: endolytic transglycosylase MltG [Ruminiclostridium sp.]|nr:endolytic transglycosylase MltG [Ruminiclostridium sp.]